MKLSELMEVLDEDAHIRVYADDDKKIAEYDGKDSIPALLCDAIINEVTACGDTVDISTGFVNNMACVDYLVDRLNDFKETVACDEYHYDSEQAVNDALENLMGNLVKDCRDIQINLNEGRSWNCGMYI